MTYLYLEKEILKTFASVSRPESDRFLWENRCGCNECMDSLNFFLNANRETFTRSKSEYRNDIWLANAMFMLSPEAFLYFFPGVLIDILKCEATYLHEVMFWLFCNANPKKKEKIREWKRQLFRLLNIEQLCVIEKVYQLYCESQKYGDDILKQDVLSSIAGVSYLISKKRAQ